MSCVQYKHEGKDENYTHNRYHEEVSSNQMTLLLLGYHLCVARYHLFFIILNIRCSIIVNITRTYIVTHIRIYK